MNIASSWVSLWIAERIDFANCLKARVFFTRCVDMNEQLKELFASEDFHLVLQGFELLVSAEIPGLAAPPSAASN